MIKVAKELPSCESLKAIGHCILERRRMRGVWWFTVFIRAVVFIKIYIYIKNTYSVLFSLGWISLCTAPSSQTESGCYYMVLPEVISTWHYRSLIIYSTSFFFFFSYFILHPLYLSVSVCPSNLQPNLLQEDPKWCCSVAMLPIPCPPCSCCLQSLSGVTSLLSVISISSL